MSWRQLMTLFVVFGRSCFRTLNGTFRSRKRKKNTSAVQHAEESEKEIQWKGKRHHLSLCCSSMSAPYLFSQRSSWLAHCKLWSQLFSPLYFSMEREGLGNWCLHCVPFGRKYPVLLWVAAGSLFMQIRSMGWRQPSVFLLVPLPGHFIYMICLRFVNHVQGLGLMCPCIPYTSKLRHLSSVHAKCLVGNHLGTGQF